MNKYKDFQYYYQRWSSLGMLDNPSPTLKLKIIYILSETPCPIPFEEIIEILEDNGEDTKELSATVQKVIDEWREFINVDELFGQIHYMISKVSFRDFLHDPRILQAAGLTVQGIIDFMAVSMDYIKDERLH